MEDIVKTGMFRQGPPYTSYPGKWFATTQEGAEAFMRGLQKYKTGQPTKIVQAEIPDNLIQISHRHDGIADAFYITEEYLDKIRPLLGE